MGIRCRGRNPQTIEAEKLAGEVFGNGQRAETTRTGCASTVGFRARRDTFLEACPRGVRVYQMSFIRQYDRLLVNTFGVVNLIRGAGGALEFLVALTDESAQGIPHEVDATSFVLGTSFFVHTVVLTASGTGLLLR